MTTFGATPLAGEHRVLNGAHMTPAGRRNPRQRSNVAPAGLAERIAQGGWRQHHIVDRLQPDRSEFGWNGIDNAESGVAFTADDPLDDFVGRTIAGAQLQQRERGAQSAQEVADPLEFDVVDQRKVEASGHLALDRLGMAQQEIEVGQHLLRVRQERVTGLGQFDAVRRALKQRHTELLFHGP